MKKILLKEIVKMRIINNKTITYLSGYLFGLSEVNGNIGDYFARVDYFIESGSKDILNDIKNLFEFNSKITLLEESYTTKYFLLEEYIAILLFSTPFGLTNISEEIIKERKKYSAFHIIDLLNIEILSKIKEEKKLFMYHLLDENSQQKYVIFDITYANKHIVFLFTCNNFNGLTL